MNTLTNQRRTAANPDQSGGLQNMKNLTKILLGILLCMAIMLSLLPCALFGNTAKAENTDTKTITGLGSGIIGNPTSGSDDSTAWAGSFIYYGKYSNNPVKYRVLTTNAKDFTTKDINENSVRSMLLDCDTTLYNSKFGDNNSWESSLIKSDLNGDKFLNNQSVFTAAEKTA